MQGRRKAAAEISAKTLAGARKPKFQTAKPLHARAPTEAPMAPRGRHSPNAQKRQNPHAHSRNGRDSANHPGCTPRRLTRTRSSSRTTRPLVRTRATAAIRRLGRRRSSSRRSLARARCGARSRNHRRNTLLRPGGASPRPFFRRQASRGARCGAPSEMRRCTKRTRAPRHAASRTRTSSHARPSSPVGHSGRNPPRADIRPHHSPPRRTCSRTRRRATFRAFGKARARKIYVMRFIGPALPRSAQSGQAARPLRSPNKRGFR